LLQLEGARGGSEHRDPVDLLALGDPVRRVEHPRRARQRGLAQIAEHHRPCVSVRRRHRGGERRDRQTYRAPHSDLKYASRASMSSGASCFVCPIVPSTPTRREWSVGYRPSWKYGAVPPTKRSEGVSNSAALSALMRLPTS